MKDKKVAPEWWRSFYEETPFEVWLAREPQELLQTLNFLRDKLQLLPGQVVFDQCCGTGSLSLPLAESGLRMIGVDLCQKFIDIASKEAETRKLEANFFCADAFEFSPQAKCDAAFNWWTSFGYSIDDSRNPLMFERVRESLKPGGLFALDYPNMVNVLRVYKEREISRQDSPQGEVEVVRETRINVEHGLREQKWTYHFSDGKELTHETSLRIYLPHQLKKMLECSGFTDIQFFGGFAGEPLSVDSGRCICLARNGS